MILLALSLPAVTILLLLILRPLILWYWRVNRAVAALEDIAASLRELPAVRDRDAQARKVKAQVVR